MRQSSEQTAAQARGIATFPRSVADLRSTQRCPACFLPLRAVVCHACGLDLSHPLAGELAALSATIADDLDARLALIDRIRREPVAPSSRPSAAAESTSPPAPVSAPEPRGSGSAASTVPASTPPRGETTHAQGRRSGVQVVLIIVGISLLSAFAVFAIVFAFIAYGEAVRTLIIAAATAATMVTATLLARRGLGVTAEGVAALGTVVLVLDAWAIRRSDLAGFAELSGPGYWGAALLIVTLVAAAWARLGRHRTPAVASAALAPLGAGLLAAQAATSLHAGAAESIGAITASIVAVVVVATGSRATRAGSSGAVRYAVALSAVVAIPVSSVPLLTGAEALAGANWLIPTIAGAGFALVAGTAAAVVVRTVNHRALASVVAAILAVTAVLVLIAALLIAAESTAIAGMPIALGVIAPAVVGAIADGARYRQRSGRDRVSLTTTALTAALVAGLSGLGAAGLALQSLITAATAGLSMAGSTIDTDVMQSGDEQTIAVASLSLALGVALALWRSTGVPLAGGRLVTATAATGAVAVLAIALTPTWALTMTAASALAIVSAGATALLRRRVSESPGVRGARAGLAIAAVGASSIAASVAWSVEGGWWVGIVVALAALGLGRAAHPAAPARVLAVAVAALLVMAAAPSLGDLLAVDPPAMTITLAGAVLAMSRLPGISPGERLGALAPALAIAMLIATIDAGGEATYAVVDTLALAVLTVALIIVTLDRRRGVDRTLALAVVGYVGALLAARGVVMVLALSGAPVSFPVPGTDRALAALAALAVMAALGARVAQRVDRRWLDGGIALAAALAFAGTVNTPNAALGYLTAAVIALALAVSRDGFLGSASRRRYGGWIALLLGTAALATFLVDEGVRDPEPFVVPVAAILLAVAVLLARTPAPPRPALVSGPTAIAAAGLLVAGLPLAVFADDGPAARGGTVGVVATVLVIAALIGRVRSENRWAGLAVTTLAAGVTVQVTLAISVVGSAVVDGLSAAHPLVQLSATLMVIMLISTAAAAWWSAARDTSGRVRSRRHAATAAATAGAAALASLALGVFDTVEPVELHAVPLALGLVLIGTLELELRADARSAPWLGPGLIALLLPSLVAVSVEADLWRVVALGIIATGVLIGGAVRRLQAPFLIGAVVLLIHVIVQSWPLLRLVGESVEWWIWLGIAGVAVVAVAARYERRLRDLQNTVRRIRELR